MSFTFVPPKDAQKTPPEFQFMVYNVNKIQNIGNMLRSAVSMNCKTIVVVGNRKLQGFGSKGTDQFIAVNYFEKIDDAHKSLHARGFEIIGVEIGNDAVSIMNPTQCFKGPTCFLFGEEGHGLTETSKKICDRFIYIPQFGCGTASLNVSNAAAIIFYHFALWAKYQESPVEGEKFKIDYTQSLTKVQKDDNGNPILNETQLAIREERQALKKQRQLQQQSVEELQEVQLQQQSIEEVQEVQLQINNGQDEIIGGNELDINMEDQSKATE